MKYGKRKYARKTRKVYTKRKKYNKRTKTNLRRYGTQISNSLNGPMAMRQIIKLRYSEDINLNAGTSLGYYDFRANSIYDPNLSGTGHQPLGHDQWAYFYDHYVVLGAKIKVTIWQGTSTATDNIFVSLALQDSANTMTNQSMIREQPRSSWSMLTTPSGGKGMRTLTKKFSAKRFFGAKSILTWDKLGASFGYNPTEDALFRIFYQNATSINSVAISANVVIDYIVLMSEPKVLNQS